MELGITGSENILTMTRHALATSRPANRNPAGAPGVPPASVADNGPATGIRFRLDDAIDGIARWLPTQSPLKDFIHHNPLHVLQNRPFHEAVALAAQVYGARSYLPLSDYQARHRRGRIHEFAIDWAVARNEPDPDRRMALRASLFAADPEAHYPPPSLALHGMRKTWLSRLEVNLDAQVHPLLFRLTANFLDQGVSRWTVARPGESLWPCVWRLVEDSFIPLYPFAEPEARSVIRLPVDEALLHCLERIVGDESLYGGYLLEMALAHPGWSGMVRVIERYPDSLLSRRAISLKEYLAVELAMELAILNLRRGRQFRSVSATPGIEQSDSFATVLSEAKVPRTLRVWHEAMEFSLHAELLQALGQTPADQDRQRHPQAQALFCLDDRECSLRRHLEEIDPDIETFGVAGYFGIDFFYKGSDDIYPVSQCPASVKPGHLVVESGTGAVPARSRPRLQPLRRQSWLRGWLLTQTGGLGYAAKMAWDVFRPGAELLRLGKLGTVESHSRLHLVRETDQPSADGRLLGFSHAEMADRLESLLRSIGLIKAFAPLVVVVAHGSSSTNNPHFAAYDCGACAGKPGAPNARAFAGMANDAKVRSLLRARGIDIPPATLFVAALHDTSRDRISYLDTQSWPDPAPESLSRFRTTMALALRRNAHERCRWFELAPSALGKAAAIAHVRARAGSIFEPRPELNHSNNLYCVVGRRALTAGLFLDRRAFLHSYDPSTDTDGSTLARILATVMPVCGGINLEYLFSRIDNAMYGAGSKLPHNVVGLLGVANGMEGDLRTGLPAQMIEVHEPARLLIVVEQMTSLLDAAIARLGSMRDWLDNEWVRLAAIDPDTRASRLYRSGDWEAVRLPEDFRTPTARHSHDIYAGHTETIPVHRLTGRRA